MRKILSSAMIGNALECYDFTIYAQLSFIISSLFFPHQTDAVAIINTFGIFAVGYFSRPIGGIIFGYIGDKRGRKNALFLSMLLMAVSTFSIGLIPSYDKIGIAAPILLLLMRLVQGLSVGGESGGGFTFIGEHAPVGKKGFYIGIFQSSFFAGILLGSVIFYAITHLLTQEQVQNWGWKLPFFFGGIIGMVGFYIRNVLTESKEFSSIKQANLISQNPIFELFKNYKKDLAYSTSILIFGVLGSFTLTVFSQNFFINICNLEVIEVTKFNSISMVIAMASAIVSGYLSDKIQNRRILSIAAWSMVLYIVPLVMIIKSCDSNYVYIAQMILAVIVGGYTGPMYSIIISFFKTNVRFTAMTLVINIIATIFGGSFPALAFWLIDKFGTNDALTIIGAYLSLAAFAAIIGLRKLNHSIAKSTKTF